MMASLRRDFFFNRNHLRQLHCQLLQATRVVSMRITMRHPNNSCQLVSEILQMMATVQSIQILDQMWQNTTVAVECGKAGQSTLH